jgi:hypothetical protein
MFDINNTQQEQQISCKQAGLESLSKCLRFLWKAPANYLAEVSKDKTVQASACLICKKLLHPGRLASLIVERLSKLSGEFLITMDVAEVLLNKVAKLQPYISSLVLKIYSNAWTTTHRFRNCQNPLSCIFGCCDSLEFGVSTDSLLHYVKCPILWKAIAKGWK